MLLGELVNNLLDNASKYSEPGTPILVRSASAATAGSVRLSVEDQGFGINEADIPRVFEPFYRSSQARSRGLAAFGSSSWSMASRLARSFGGSIEVESDLQNGSIFTVRFLSRAPHAFAPGSAQVIVGNDRPHLSGISAAISWGIRVYIAKPPRDVGTEIICINTSTHLLGLVHTTQAEHRPRWLSAHWNRIVRANTINNR